MQRKIAVIMSLYLNDNVDKVKPITGTNELKNILS